MKRKTLIKTIVTGLAFSLIPVYLASCNPSQDDPLYNGRRPHYLLDPENNIQVAPAGDNNLFDYYPIGTDDDENKLYAVSLKDKSYSSGYHEDTGEYDELVIPSEYRVNQVKKGIVTGIWHNAFHNCPATSITIPETIQTIDYEAFLFSGITSITVPYTVTAIGEGAFYGCHSLLNANIKTSSASGTGAIVSCACDNVGDGDPTPSELTVIPSFCFFDCDAMTSLTLPNSVEEIRYDAFRGCKKLSSKLYFESITTIRARAFEGCTSLTEVYFPKAFFDGNGLIEEHAFNYCSKGLQFYFCGAVDDSGSTPVTDVVETWVGNHANWGWFNDAGNPQETSNGSFVNRYDYNPVYGDIHYTEDWIYSVTDKGTHFDATIEQYRGAQTPTYLRIPDVMPYAAGQKITYVRLIKDEALASFKSTLERIYLPTTLYAINNYMFRGFTKLYVVDDNTGQHAATTGNCEEDRKKATPKGRIDLSLMEDLEFIGTRAFPLMGTPSLRNKVEYIHLPANIRAIGPEAFSTFSTISPDENPISKGSRFKEVKDFLWDYNDASSRLEVIGNSAFYKMGDNGSKTDFSVAMPRRDDVNPTTVIFPRTFKGFGLSKTDLDNYALGISAFDNNQSCTIPFSFASISGKDGDGIVTNDESTPRPGRVFASCPLLGKVVFKGSNTESLTTNLIIPIQTFLLDDNLQTIIFEERNNHTITFHTQKGAWGQQTIGSAGGGMNNGAGIYNDFRSDPMIQTIVLPNKTTNLIFQDFALAGNARAAIYLTGKLGDTDPISGNKRIRSETSNYYIYKDVFAPTPIENAPNWRMIGDESFTAFGGNSKDGRSGYFGYCFNDAVGTKATGSVNSFGLNQQIPVYEDVYFTETFSHSGNNITVSAGDANGAKQLKIVGKYAFVCENKQDVPSSNGVSFAGTAVLSNYLYDINDLSSSEKYEVEGKKFAKAHVPAMVTVGNSKYKVNAIGDSAFSACFCDGKDTAETRELRTFYDLACVELPDSIESIGEYAFMRAYGVTNIKTYTYNYSTEEEVLGSDYEMPSSLAYIGRHAFAFCNIEEFLEIPDACQFYDTTNDTYNVSSVFSNNFSLKKITFRAADNNDDDPTSSTYYRTTSYSQTPVRFSIYREVDVGYSVYLVGSFNEWTLSDESKMNSSDQSIWTTEVVLFSGVYNYKYVIAPSTLTGENENWDILNNENRTFDASQYNSTFSIDYDAHLGNAMYLAASFNEWAVSASTRMNLLDSSNWYKDLALPAGTYEYKFVKADYDSPSPSQPDWIPNSNISVGIIGGRETYTNALYSTGATTYNQNRLLLVLNRDSNAIEEGGLGEGALYASAEESSLMLSDDSYILGTSFDGQYEFYNDYPINAPLFGAYKMGYWIYSLSVGPLAYYHTRSFNANKTLSFTYEVASGRAVWIAYKLVSESTYTIAKLSNSGTTWSRTFSSGEYVYYYFEAGSSSSADNPKLIVVDDNPEGEKIESKLAHPLFSGIVNRAIKGGEMSWNDSYIYLNVPIKPYDLQKAINDFEPTACDLVYIAGKVTQMTPDALRGCENLAYLLLEYDAGGVLPPGLTASAGDVDLIYATPGNAEGTTTIAELGTLNMRYTGYSKIGDEVFKESDSVVRFTAPEVNGFVIGDYAFQDAATLTSADLSHVTGSLSIGNYAFQGSSITDFTVPAVSSLTLGDYAFQGCEFLETIDLSAFNGSSLTISKYCFEGCTNLKTIKWPRKADVTFTFCNGAFANCTSFKGDYNENPNDPYKLVLPAKTTRLGYDSNASNGTLGPFQNCTSLTEVLFPQNLKDTGHFIFAGCTNLETVGVSGGTNSKMQFFNRFAFKDCTSLVNFDFSAFTYSSFKIYRYVFQNTGKVANGNGIWDVILPSNYVSVGEGAFKNSRLRSLTIQNTGTFTFDGTSSFYNCDHLTTISFASTTNIAGTSTPTQLFNDCGALTTINFPTSQNVTLFSQMFQNCTALTIVNFPTDTTKTITLGSQCFKGCTSLPSITFTTSSLTPANSAFEACTSLSGVYFSVPDCAWNDANAQDMFKNCYSLVELCLPSSFPASTSSSNYKNFVNGASKSDDLKIFLYASSYSVGSTQWYKYKSSAIGSNYIYAKVNEYSDVYNAGNVNQSYKFWSLVNDRPVALGTAISGDSNSVVFDSGYVLFSDLTVH